VALISCVAIFVSAAEAMRVAPMVVELTTVGTGATARVEVQNLNQGSLPFETRITRIDYDANGNRTETPADADFLVFPPQGLLPPNARQVIRVQWVGAPDLPASQSYYLSVNQLPVALGEQPKSASNGQVQIIYHMKALITVAPPGAAPKITVSAAVPTEIQPKAEEGAPATAPAPAKLPGVMVTIHNSGNRYAMMAGEKWIIEGSGVDNKPLRVEISREDLSRLIGVGYVAPTKGEKTFTVPTGTAFKPGSIKVRFSQ
jgi:fimbrial chaperone protein